MENHTIVTLKKGEGRTIKAGGAWIFDNEITEILLWCTISTDIRWGAAS
mgnify:CR=1 FL=1